VPGELRVTVTVDAKGFAAGTAGIEKDKTGDFLDLVLADAGLNFAAATPGTPTRRLTDEQVQKELMFHHRSGDAILDSASEFEFEHDPASGEFAACDPNKCTIKKPAANRRVGLRKATIAGVEWFALLSFTNSTKRKTDLIEGQRMIRDKFGFGNTSLRLLDQRHVVGLTRLCRMLRGRGIQAVYTQGVSGDNTRTDCHGHGTALDLGGVATQPPDPTDKKPRVRLGIDFIVFSHWGNLPMFDGKTVAANPTNPAAFVRLKVNDDGFDYSTDPTGATRRLRYRLDPPPFQDPVPAPGPTPEEIALNAELVKVAPHFVAARDHFRAIYGFSTAEYSDSNNVLGPTATPDVTTPIDSHDGKFILHPDYPEPGGAKNGRTAHINHFHIQLGRTELGAVRTT
jgi:hypothetical protein